jgi:hypothetical protein
MLDGLPARAGDVQGHKGSLSPHVGTARSRSGRNSSKSTRSVSRSSASPLADNSCRHPSTSEDPRCCAIPFTSHLRQQRIKSVPIRLQVLEVSTDAARLVRSGALQVAASTDDPVESPRKGTAGLAPSRVDVRSSRGAIARSLSPSSAPSRLAQSCAPPLPALSTASPAPASGCRFRLGFLYTFREYQIVRSTIVDFADNFTG